MHTCTRTYKTGWQYMFSSCLYWTALAQCFQSESTQWPSSWSDLCASSIYHHLYFVPTSATVLTTIITGLHCRQCWMQDTPATFLPPSKKPTDKVLPSAKYKAGTITMMVLVDQLKHRLERKCSTQWRKVRQMCWGALMFERFTRMFISLVCDQPGPSDELELTEMKASWTVS